MSFADVSPITAPPPAALSYPAIIGPTAPGSPTQGAIWIDNSAAALLIKVFDGGAWVTAGQQTIPPQLFRGALSAAPSTAAAGEVYYLIADIMAPGTPSLVPWDPLMLAPLQGGAEPDPANPAAPKGDGAGGVVAIPSTPPLWGTTYLGVSYVISGGSAALIARINAGETTPVQFSTGVNPPMRVYQVQPPLLSKGFYRHDGTAWNLIPPVPNGTKTGDTLAWDNAQQKWVLNANRMIVGGTPANPSGVV